MNRDPIAGFRLGALLAERFEGGRVFAARLGDTPMEQLRQQLLMSGLTLAGAAVSDAGAVPLSTLRFLIRENGASGGAAADGERWIACGAGGRPIPAAELETLARVGEAHFRGGEPAEPQTQGPSTRTHLQQHPSP